MATYSSEVGIRYAIISEIIEMGLLPDLYKKFSMSVFYFHYCFYTHSDSTTQDK